jgi:hypothetical protein
MLACLTVLRVLFFIIAGLLVLLGLKSLIDPALSLGLVLPLVLALGAACAGFGLGWLRRLLGRKGGLTS